MTTKIVRLFNKTKWLWWYQVSACVAAMTPTLATEALMAGLKVLVWSRSDSAKLQTLTTHELVHMFNLFYPALNENQRKIVLG